MSATRKPFSGLAALRRDEALRPPVELAHPIPDLECGEPRAGLELSILPDGDTKVPGDLADPQTARLRSRSNVREHRSHRLRSCLTLGSVEVLAVPEPLCGVRDEVGVLVAISARSLVLLRRRARTRPECGSSLRGEPYNGRRGKWGGGTAPRPCAPRFPRQPHETRAVRECDGVLVLRMSSSYRRMSSQKEMMTNGVRISTATHNTRRALLFSGVVNR